MASVGVKSKAKCTGQNTALESLSKSPSLEGRKQSQMLRRYALPSLLTPWLTTCGFRSCCPPTLPSRSLSNMGFCHLRREEGWLAQQLTHLMSVLNCKNNEFLSAPTERRRNRTVVYHALGIHLAGEATPEFSPGLHSGIRIRPVGTLNICPAASPPIFCGSQRKPSVEVHVGI